MTDGRKVVMRDGHGIHMGKGSKKSFGRTRMVSTLDKVVISEVYTFVKTHLIYTFFKFLFFY